MLIFNPNARLRYTPKSERGKPNPAVFIYHPPKHAWLADRYAAANAMEIVEEHLVDWENVHDESGTPVAVPEKGKGDLLRWAHAQELAAEILNSTLLTEEERGK